MSRATRRELIKEGIAVATGAFIGVKLSELKHQRTRRNVRRELPERHDGTYSVGDLTANQNVLRTVASGETLSIGIHYLDFQDADSEYLGDISGPVEEIINNLHPDIFGDVYTTCTNVPELAAKKGYSEEEVKKTLKGIKKPDLSKLPEFHETTNWLDIEDEDDAISTYVGPFEMADLRGNHLGGAFPAYGEVFVDWPYIDTTQKMIEVVGHEYGHILGVSHTDSGIMNHSVNGERYWAESSINDFDRIYSSFLNER